MKKIVLAIVFSVFILSSCFIKTSALAWGRDPELSPSQKQEILDVLGQIKRYREEVERVKKQIDELYSGENEAFNNRSFVIELRKEAEDIWASSTGQRMGRKVRGWDKTDKTKPLFDFFNEEEFEAYKRITEIGNEIGGMHEGALEGRKNVLGSAMSHLDDNEEELKKLERKYGKAAVDALKGEVEERDSGEYLIDAYPVNEKLLGAKGQVSITLSGARGDARVSINFKHRIVTSDNVMKMEYLTVKNNYLLSEFKQTEDKVFFTINSVEYEHILYLKHSLIALGMGSKNTLRKDWEVVPYTKNEKIHNLTGVINLSDGSFNGKCGKMTLKGHLHRLEG